MRAIRVRRTRRLSPSTPCSDRDALCCPKRALDRKQERRHHSGFLSRDGQAFVSNKVPCGEGKKKDRNEQDDQRNSKAETNERGVRNGVTVDLNAGDKRHRWKPAQFLNENPESRNRNTSGHHCHEHGKHDVPSHPLPLRSEVAFVAG